MSDSSSALPSFCSRCGEQLQPAANFCPTCAAPTRAPVTHSFRPVVDITPTRKVGVGLGLGIFFLPYVFSWFTLRQGHTTLAKTVSFIWLGLVVFVWATHSNESKTTNSSAVQTSSYQATSESPKDAALRQVSIDFKWTKGGFGGVMIADFTITNLSNHSV